MGSRNYAKRAVLLGKIVKHPDRIANPIATFVRDSTHIRVQEAAGNPNRVRRASVQAAQLEIRTQDGSDELTGSREGRRYAEISPLCHQIGKPPGAGFLPELRSGILALFLEQLFDAVSQSFEQFG